MRVLQIIDSLDAGGAERIAVNYANALSGRIDFSGLVTTRREGVLKNEMMPEVSYLFLNKKSTFDLKAAVRLHRFAAENKIDIIHAHGPSFFTAVMLKVSLLRIKIVWHEHYGARASQSRNENLPLFLLSSFFSMVLVVNRQLEVWVKENLRVSKVFYMPNFTASKDNGTTHTSLNGEDGKRIVILANLKHPKNHIMALKAFTEIGLGSIGWSLHLIGRDYNDAYSQELKQYITDHNAQNSIYIYGAKTDIRNILSQASIGMLSSVDEGFPVSLLEYGMAKLAVISTNAGFCSQLIIDGHTGLTFDPHNDKELLGQLVKLAGNETQREKFALNLHHKVIAEFSEETVLNLLLDKYDLL